MSASWHPDRFSWKLQVGTCFYGQFDSCIKDKYVLLLGLMLYSGSSVCSEVSDKLLGSPVVFLFSRVFNRIHGSSVSPIYFVCPGHSLHLCVQLLISPSGVVCLLRFYIGVIANIFIQPVAKLIPLLLAVTTGVYKSHVNFEQETSFMNFRD